RELETVSTRSARSVENGPRCRTEPGHDALDDTSSRLRSSFLHLNLAERSLEKVSPPFIWHTHGLLPLGCRGRCAQDARRTHLACRGAHGIRVKMVGSVAVLGRGAISRRLMGGLACFVLGCASGPPPRGHALYTHAQG